MDTAKNWLDAGSIPNVAWEFGPVVLSQRRTVNADTKAHTDNLQHIGEVEGRPAHLPCAAPSWLGGCLPVQSPGGLVPADD